MLTGGTTLTIGPGSLLEVQEAGKVRLMSGECQIDRGEGDGEKTPFELLGPKDGSEPRRRWKAPVPGHEGGDARQGGRRAAVAEGVRGSDQ